MPNASNTSGVTAALPGRRRDRRALRAGRPGTARPRAAPARWTRASARSGAFASHGSTSRGVEVRVAGTGYTGEDGVEIAVPNEVAERPAARRWCARASPPPGLGARDTLRLEAALPLYGHELTPSLDHARGPSRLGPRLGQADLPRARGRGGRARARADAGCSPASSPTVASPCATAARWCVDGRVVGVADARGTSRRCSGAASGWDCLTRRRSTSGTPVTVDAARSRGTGDGRRASLRAKGVADVADYLPHTADEVDEMLDFLGLDSLEQLFEPHPVRGAPLAGLDLPAGQSEPDVAAQFARYTSANRATASDDDLLRRGRVPTTTRCPPSCKRSASRSEFVTAYTPYQPEVAQGVLQAIFEYPDVRLAPERAAHRQRVALRRRHGAGRGAQHGRAARPDAPTMVISCGRAPALARGRAHLRCGHGPRDRRGARCATASPTGRASTRRGRGDRRGLPELPRRPRGPRRPRKRARRRRRARCSSSAADPVAAGVLQHGGPVGRRRLRRRGSALRHARSPSAGPTSDSSRARWTRCAACPGGSWARRSTRTTGAPSSRPCAPASRTSAARRRPRTSAPTRP